MADDLVDIDTPVGSFDIDANFAGSSNEADDQAVGVREVESD
jgi:hypothetical protein